MHKFYHSVEIVGRMDHPYSMPFEHRNTITSSATASTPSSTIGKLSNSTYNVVWRTAAVLRCQKPSWPISTKNTNSRASSLPRTRRPCVIGIIVGSGIFLVPREMMAAVDFFRDCLCCVDSWWPAVALRCNDLRRDRRRAAEVRRRVCLPPRGVRRRLPPLKSSISRLGNHREALLHRVDSIGCSARAWKLQPFRFSLHAVPAFVTYGQLVAIAFVWLITGTLMSTGRVARRAMHSACSWV